MKEVHELSALGDQERLSGPVSNKRLERVNEEAFYSNDPAFAITEEDLKMLREEVFKTSRQRIRICTHRNINDTLHEMYVCYTKTTDIHPHKHMGKDELFYVIEGEMDVCFYDDYGNLTDVLPMGERTKGKPFCVRMPMNTFHSVKLLSEICILHEATPGPYVRSDTIWAEWTHG